MPDRRRILTLLLALSAAGPATAADLMARLRRGGLVILLRHARTVPGTGDPPGFRLEDCATQRNLGEAGRAQARAIGTALRAAQVPVDRVLSSRWCRCLETARLLDLGEVEPFPAIDSFFEDRSRRAGQTADAQRFIRTWKGPGNALLVSHQVNITALTRVFPRCGEAVAVSPALEVLGQAVLG